MSLGRELTEADRGKRFVTRNGRVMQFIGINGEVAEPFFRAIFGDKYGTTQRHVTGEYFDDKEESENDIVSEYTEPPKPVTVEAWVNIYSDGPNSARHATKPLADWHAMDGRIACVLLTGTYTPGEGL